MNTLIFAAAVAATNAVANLPPVVVEASRLGKSTGEIPGPVQVISRDEIARSGARDLPDMLQKKVATLDFARLGGNNPALTQIAPRGYGENGFGRLLVMVDGERINNPDMSAPSLAQVPLGSITRVEILRGSQNVLHGDPASAGMINIVTDSEDYGTHGHVELHGGSWDTIGASASVRGGVEETGTRYWANGGWDHSDGYRDDNGFDIYNAGGGVKQNFDNGSYLRLSAFYSDVNSDLAGDITKAQWHSDLRASDGFHDFYRRTTYGLNATAYGIIDDDNAIRLRQTVSRRHMQSRASSLWGAYDMDNDIYSYELNPEWLNTSRIGSFDNDFIMGASFRYDRNHGGSWLKGMPHSKFKSAYVRQTMGFYAQDTFHVTDEVALEFGGRYERSWNMYKTTGTLNRAYDLAAYDAALLVTPVDGLKTYFKFSNFYHMPFIDETGFGLANYMLSPERGVRVDAGFDWAFLEDFSLAANAYVSRTKREIFLEPYIYNNINSPSPVQREGFDVSVGWERDKVAGVAIAYSYVNAEFDGGEFDGNDVPMAARSLVTANGRVWLWDDCFVFGGYRFRTDCYSISDFRNSDEKLAGFGIFSAGAQYSPSYGWLDGLTFSLTVDNLFDKDYCDYSVWSAFSPTGYYPASGRSYTFTVRYEF